MAWSEPEASSRLQAALRRPRLVTLGLLIALIMLAWVWLLTGHRGMLDESTMPGMPMDDIDVQWDSHRFSLTLSMWVIMMTAMMLPSAAPTILLFDRVAEAGTVARPPTGFFLAGYLLAWGLFSLGATMAQLLLDQSGLTAPMRMAITSQRLSGAVLLLAGGYQLSPWKDTCLRQCRSPAEFLSRHFRPGRAGAVRMGLVHGAFCVGCCWMLMALLFVGGIMNLAWIAAITLLVALEKLLPHGRIIAVLSGVALLGWSAVLLLGGVAICGWPLRCKG